MGILYVVKNLWVFGYPLFPIGVLDMGLSWKPHADLFVESSKVAILKTYDLQYSLEEIAQFSWWDYIVNWLFLSGIKGIIHCLFIVMLIGFAIFVKMRNKPILTLIFISIIIKSVLVLGFSAQYRFFIDVFFAIFIVVSGQVFSKKWAMLFFSVGAFLVINLLFFPKILSEKVPSFNLGHYMGGFRWEQLYKPSYYAFNQYDSYQIGDLKFNVPRNYIFDFDVDLPVITLDNLEEFYEMDIFPQKIGKTLKEGFIWKQLTSQEKVELRQIIKKIKQKK